MAKRRSRRLPSQKRDIRAHPAKLSQKRDTRKPAARKPAPRTPAPRKVSPATREKISRARQAFIRTRLTKAERELRRLEQVVARQREKVAVLRREQARKQQLSQKAYAYQRAIRALQAAQGISRPEAITLHKDQRAAAIAASRERPRQVGWAPPEGTEGIAFGLRDASPEIAGWFPHGSIATAMISVELWHTGPMPGAAGMSAREIINRQVVNVSFATGATYDEFWANFFGAMRIVRDAAAEAMGFRDGYRRGGGDEGVEDSASYTVLGIAA